MSHAASSSASLVSILTLRRSGVWHARSDWRYCQGGGCLSVLYEELDHCPQEIGIVSLRRRWEPRLDKDIYEIKRGDEHLMSGAFPVVEIAPGR